MQCRILSPIFSTIRHGPTLPSTLLQRIMDDRSLALEQALDAYAQNMLDDHTRLIEVTVDSHEGEWAATKHAYPPEAFEKLKLARANAGWAPGLNDEFASNTWDLPQPLVKADGTLSDETSLCCLCFHPLLTRPSMDGPFTVGFSVQVPFRERAACDVNGVRLTKSLYSNTMCTTAHTTKMKGRALSKVQTLSCMPLDRPRPLVQAIAVFFCGSCFA